MIKGILFFILVWILVIIGIQVFRILTSKEKWVLTKVVSFGAATAFVATVIVVFIVVIF